MSNSRSRRTSPRTVDTSSAEMLSPANAITWSNALCASRMLPSPARAISISAASSIRICSASAIVRSWSAIGLTPIVFSSNTCERDWMVAGTFSISVVAIMKTTCGGGSSIDFRSASKDCGESRWTSSMMKIL